MSVKNKDNMTPKRRSFLLQYMALMWETMRILLYSEKNEVATSFQMHLQMMRKAMMTSRCHVGNPKRGEMRQIVGIPPTRGAGLLTEIHHRGEGCVK